MGVARWLLVVVLFALSSVFEYLVGPSFWSGLLAKLTFGAGIVALLVAAALALRGPLWRMTETRLDTYVESRLESRARSYLDTVVGSAIVRSMPPGDVLRILLQRVYPARTDYGELTTWMLGGAGRDPDCGDTVVSYDTWVRYRIEPVDDVKCLSYLECRYRYTGVQDNHLLVIFATSSLQVARLLATERIYPLYDLWILEEGDLDEFIPNQQATVQVGMRYEHDGGCGHVVEPAPLIGEEVDYRSYERYLRIPAKFDRNDIRIFVLDLHDLVEDHVVDKIDEVTLHSSNVANTDRGYLTWWPPHPCYVRSVSFDLTEFRRANEHRHFVYQIVTSCIGSAGMPMREWTRLGDTISVPVEAWMLPGHNVTLVYRPSVEDGIPDGHDRGGDR